MLRTQRRRRSLCCSSYIPVSKGSSEEETAKMSYGNIMRVETTGSSEASNKLAADDAGRMEKYRSKINTVGRKYGIDPALIAAIISRESSAGATLDNGWGDNRKAWGLMQVDVVPVEKGGGGHTPEGAWDSEKHLCQATEILIYFIKRIGNKFPSWNTEQRLRGGLAAYNKGDGNVHSYAGVDAKTTGGNYSNDVVIRAKWYKNNKGY